MFGREKRVLARWAPAWPARAIPRVEVESRPLGDYGLFAGLCWMLWPAGTRKVTT